MTQTAAPGGYHGRIAHVDLTSGAVWYDEHDQTWYRRYGGGGALAAWYLLRDIGAGTDALAPENVLIFASSVVAGVDAPALSKHTVLAKSPLTGGAGESQSVSTFAPAFKSSGVDALVVHGRAESPVQIVLCNGTAEVLDATSLWGLETADAHEALLGLHGPKAHTSIIGAAGENLVRFASIVNDVRFMNARTGMGAVMGSKHLKAVVAIPTTPALVAEPETAGLAIDDFWANRRTCGLNRVQEDFGVASWLADTPEGGGWPVVSRNFQRAVFPAVGHISGTVMNERYLIAAEPPPNIEYAQRYAVMDGPFATDPRYGGLEVNTAAALGPMIWVDDLEALLKAAELTYRHGLDPESLGATLAWVMECGERGAMPNDVFADGIPAFGDADGIVAVIEDIAHRRGAGDLLAEGSARAAAALGHGTSAFAMTCKGKEIPPHEPRNKPGLALAYGAGPIGPDYCVVEHDWDYSPDGFPYILDNSRAYGMLERNPEHDLGPSKVRQVVMLQRWWSGALESLLFDLFGIAPARYMPPTRVEQLIRGITGWDFSIHELMLIGARRITLLQVFNRREGLTRADDALPDRFFDEPIPEGAYHGWVLDRDRYADALTLYFEMNGWDNDGMPTRATLHELELGWAIDHVGIAPTRTPGSGRPFLETES